MNKRKSKAAEEIPFLPGVRQPKQNRSQQTTDRIVRAAIKLLERKRFEDISVEEIAKEARVSIGGFYARFESKEALLHWFDNNLLEQELGLRLEELDVERWKNKPIEAIIRSYIAMGTRFMRRYRPVLARIALQLRGNPEKESAERARRFNEKVHEPLLRLLRERKSEITHPDPEFAARFGLLTVSAAMRDWILFNQRGAYKLTGNDRKVVDELTRVYLGYLKPNS